MNALKHMRARTLKRAHARSQARADTHAGTQCLSIVSLMTFLPRQVYYGGSLGFDGSEFGPGEFSDLASISLKVKKEKQLQKR